MGLSKAKISPLQHFIRQFLDTHLITIGSLYDSILFLILFNIVFCLLATSFPFLLFAFSYIFASYFFNKWHCQRQNSLKKHFKNITILLIVGILFFGLTTSVQFYQQVPIPHACAFFLQTLFISVCIMIGCIGSWMSFAIASNRPIRQALILSYVSFLRTPYLHLLIIFINFVILFVLFYYYFLWIVLFIIGSSYLFTLCLIRYLYFFNRYQYRMIRQEPLFNFFKYYE